MALLADNMVDTPTPSISVGRIRDMEVEGDAYQRSGDNPFVELVPSEPISPKDVGLLHFQLGCSGQAGPLPVRVSWASKDEPYNRYKQLSFNMTYPENLVPLDASVDWLLSEPVERIRLEFGANNDYCDAMELTDLRLLQRKVYDDQ